MNSNSVVFDEDAAAQYLEDYLDFSNNIPDEIARHVTILHEIAAKMEDGVVPPTSKHIFIYSEREREDVYRELDQHWETLQMKDLDSVVLRRTLLLAQNALIQAQELGDNKLQQWQIISDIIDNKARTLDLDKKRLDFGRENDVHNENHKTEAQPERTSKRPRRSRNIDMTLRDDSIHEKPEKDLPTPTISKKQKKKKRKAKAEKEEVTLPFEPPIDPDEPTYCLCDQVSYGEMICCDNHNCPREWFHFSCVGLTFKPKGKWYCPKCRGERSNQMKPQTS